jgi:hypothetical protein
MGSYPQQMFTRDAVPGAGIIAQALATVPTSAANSQVIRPTLVSTFPASRRHRQRGGSYRKQKKQTQKQKQQKQQKQQRGGFFSPSVMGPFLKNVEALAAPVSIYLAYKMVKAMRGGKKTRKN